MNNRIEAIRRMAEHDPYWRGYLDGMRDAHAVGRAHDRTAELVEANRLLQARLARAVDDAAQRSEFHSVDESRARLNARRGNWDDDWSPTPAA